MAPMRTDNRKKNRLTAMVLFTVAGGMVGLAFAAVPLYKLFCQVTGFGGTPKIAAQHPAAAPSDRTITVRFDANTNPALPWRFLPEKTQVTVRAGEACVLAGLAASGRTSVTNLYQLARGHAQLEERLQGLGAQIERL